LAGKTIEVTCEADDPLAVVYAAILQQTGEGEFMLSTPFPRRVFQKSELEHVTAKAAGLSPKGTLIMQKAIATDVKQDTNPFPSDVKTGVVHHVHSAEQYEKLKATTGKLVVVDFSAEWCGPCKMIAPHFEKIAKETPAAVFIHLDTDEVKVADSRDVKGIPTFKFFKNSKLVHSFSGASVEDLVSSVGKYK
jgi:thioredoxin